MYLDKRVVFGFALNLGLWTGVGVVAAPLGTAFTYQGQLKQGAAPFSGMVDLEFRLFSALVEGTSVGSPITKSGVAVTNGLLTVDLDFGVQPFDGQALFLEISVQTTTPGGGFTTLSPRQPLTAVPLALYALDGPGQAGFWEANGNHIYKTNSGNVGIGTSNPQRILHTVGNAVLFERAVNDAAVLLRNTFNGTLNAAFGLRNTGPSTGFAYVSDQTQSPLLHLQDGNVGIGTAAPQDKLHVAGSVLADGSLRSLSPGQEASVFLGWSTEGRGDNVARIRIGGNPPAAYNGLDIQRVGDVSLMRILDNGSVGLGTQSPQYRLHAVGDIASEGGVLQSSNPNNPGAVAFFGWGADGDGNDVARIRIGGDGPGATNGLDIQRTSNVSLMRIHNNGDVEARGVLDIGIETLSKFCSGNTCTVLCPSGKAALSGGCSTHCGHCGAITMSSPLECAGVFCSGDVPTGWYCEDDGGAGSAIVAHVVCARVR